MKLAESLTIFRSLGWHEAPVTDALTLPLGTPEQQKLALAGLRSGEWGRGGRTKENPRYHWISYVEGHEFNETALACLYAKTAQAQLKTLSLLEGRELDTTLCARVAELAASTSAKVAKKAAAFVSPLLAEKPPADLWRDTPPVWHMPRFERPPATVDTLVAGLPRVTIDRSRWETFIDEHAERFLAGLVELAAADPAAARQAASGADEHVFTGLLHKWAHGQDITVDERHTLDRIHCIMAVLGRIPCMLSEPSFADLSISLPDLCARLARYQESGAAVLIADFLLALYRLRITDDFTSVPEFPIALVHIDGTQIDATAGDVLRGYLDDPVVDRGIYLHNGVHPRYRHEIVALPESLTSVPGLYPADFATHNISLDAASFPTFGDSVLLDVGRGLVPQSAVRAAV